MDMRFILLLSALLCAGAEAKGIKVDGIIGADDRKPAAADFPWASVGKVALRGESWLGNCTGTLIAPDLVLTAAHCVSDLRLHKVVPLANVNFLLGLKRDAFLDHATAKCVALFGALPDRTRPDATPRNEDMAVIRLNRKVKGAPMGWALDTASAAGAVISVAGYGQDRSFWPVMHQGCQVTWNAGGLAGTNCDATHGQSGGPVLTRENGELKLAGILVAVRGGVESAIIPSPRLKAFVAAQACKE